MKEDLIVVREVIKILCNLQVCANGNNEACHGCFERVVPPRRTPVGCAERRQDGARQIDDCPREQEDGREHRRNNINAAGENTALREEPCECHGGPRRVALPTALERAQQDAKQFVVCHGVKHLARAVEVAQRRRRRREGDACKHGINREHRGVLKYVLIQLKSRTRHGACSHDGHQRVHHACSVDCEDGANWDAL